MEEWEGKLRVGRQVGVPAVEEELVGELELPVVKVPAASEVQPVLEVQPALEVKAGRN